MEITVLSCEPEKTWRLNIIVFFSLNNYFSGAWSNAGMSCSLLQFGTMNQRGAAVVVIFYATGLLSCGKHVSGGEPPPGSRVSILIGSTWQIRSAASIDSLSVGAARRYLGVVGDTLSFLWDVGNTINVYGINASYKNATSRTSVRSIALYDPYRIPTGDTSSIAYDTILCGTQFRPFYSDTLFVTKVSPTTFVFRVRFSDNNGKGVEIDTLSNVRNH